MQDKIYITGHKNPDTDSIASSIAYCELMRKKGEIAEAIRLGDLNKESKFVLDYFNIKEPRLKTSIKPQVRDLKMDKAYLINENLSLKSAMEIIEKNNLNSLCVIDENENLIGIVSLSNIASSYMEVWDNLILGRSNTSIYNIVDVLKADILYMPKNPRNLSGKMAVKSIKNKELIEKNDIVICGDDENLQRSIINMEASLLILTVSTKLSNELLELAKEKNVAVISSGLTTFMVARFLPQAVPVSHVMTRDNLVVFSKDDYIDDVRDIMAKSRFRSYPVLDDKKKVIGNISRFHLISHDKKKIILVDHNERTQSIDDLNTAEVLQIIDHHRVANIETNTPVYFRNEPVGSTATIISKMYFEEGIMPSKEIAGLLCSAIISDTLLFRSPTSTDTDKFVLDKMSKIANINVEEFADLMFKKGTSLEGAKPDKLLSSDVKEFTIGVNKLRVCQIFTMDLSSLDNIEEELVEEMKKNVSRYDLSSFILMITDIFNEKSQVLIEGSFKEEIAREFGEKLVNNKFIAPGLLSRKKQMIPKITDAIVAQK